MLDVKVMRAEIIFDSLPFRFIQKLKLYFGYLKHSLTRILI